jgi:hypothetical protein
MVTNRPRSVTICGPRISERVLGPFSFARGHPFLIQMVNSVVLLVSSGSPRIVYARGNSAFTDEGMQMLNSVLTGDVLGDKRARLLLRQRKHPYYLGLMMGRSLGYCRKTAGNGRWVARVRTIHDRYLEKTLGYADDYAIADGQKVLSFVQAQESAKVWFHDASHLLLRTEARRFGQTEELNVCPIGNEYTVAHAIKDFVDWRRDFGARQSFIASISLANTYILPTVGSIPCSELTSSQLRSVLLGVEGTARKRGG